MTNLAEVLDSIKSELTVDANGVGYCSIRGAARLADIDESSLREHINKLAAGIFSSKLATTLSQHGFEGAGFAVNGIPDVALGLILNYYASKAGSRCTKQAKECCEVFLSVGIRQWIQHTAEWVNPNLYCEFPPRSEKFIFENKDNFAEEIAQAFQILKTNDPIAARELLIDFNNKEGLTDFLNVEPVNLEEKKKEALLREQLLDLSLVANRMGLAFNKHLKTFEKLESTFDVDNLVELRQQLNKTFLEIDALNRQLKYSQNNMEYYKLQYYKCLAELEFMTNQASHWKASYRDANFMTQMYKMIEESKTFGKQNLLGSSD